MTGYVIFAGCTGLLVAVYLSLRNRITAHDINSMIFGGKEAGRLGLTCSVLAAWMWTTSVYGSSETYSVYGIWGPVSYVVGACIAFAGLIGVLVFLRKRYPMVVTWIEFIKIRYGRRAVIWFYLFAVIVPAYVLVEQGVGIADTLEDFYGSSFRLIAFFSVIIATGFVFFGGMKAVLAEEKIAALIIIAGFLIGAVWVIAGGHAAAVETHEIIADSSGFAFRTGMSALQYFIVAIVIAFGQIALDPAYYLKAQLLKSTKKMTVEYLLGGIILWGFITLASSVYMGYAASSAAGDIDTLFSGPAKGIFSTIIVVIGVSTIAHFMIGLLGSFSTDLYEAVVKPDGTDTEKIVFGRIMIIAVGLSCASITIALENISLLTIDVFCAIFFAAPCVPLVIGCLSRRNFGRLPVISMIAGTIAGLVVWMAMPGSILQNQLAGLAASILISLLIMLIGCVHRMQYDG